VKDKNIGKHIVPIVPDEARTFGMEGMFRQIGIYSSVGQLYTPQDADQLMFYREDKQGQILEEGINEAGRLCSWIAAATAYANHGVNMVPFYIYYSMFGFQRVGDFIWAAGDSQARGFLVGGTAGARRSPARACSIRTATASWWRPRCRIASPTIRPMPTSWR
jgi:pyruvate dehydrogenase E1 component